MYIITVKTFEGVSLKFTLTIPPSKENGRVIFIDERTGLLKDFPASIVCIEEVKT